MAVRIPLVLAANGLPEQLQSGDTLPGAVGPVNVVSYGAAHTVVAADVPQSSQYQALIGMTGATGAAAALTIPPNSSVPLPNGTLITAQGRGAGILTVTPGSGVTFIPTGIATARAVGSCITLVQTEVLDTWAVMGDTTP